MEVKEFALDPAVPAQSFKDCRYFLDALRIEHGRVLARFPKKWKRMAYESAQTIHAGQVELLKIERLLGKLTNKAMFSCGRPSGDPNEPWLERAITEHERLPFAAIIAQEAKADAPFVIPADDVDTCEAFEATGQDEIKRRSQQIIGCVALLLRAAMTVKLIDPHFDARAPRWRRSLQKLIETVPAGATVEIHRKNENVLESNKRGQFDGPIQKVLRGGVIVKVFLHDPSKMHNRFILTEQGGVMFGTGLDDHEDGKEGITDHDHVTLLTEVRCNTIWNEYPGTGDPFLVIP